MEKITKIWIPQEWKELFRWKKSIVFEWLPFDEQIKNSGDKLSKEMCDLLVHYNTIGKSDILNIHKYLMLKNNIK